MKKLFYYLIVVFVFLSCEKEVIINRIEVTDGDDNGEYVIQPQENLTGNVKITIVPSYNQEESKVEIENRMDFPIGYKISSVEDPNFVYFYDSYIGAKKTTEKTGTAIPYNTPINLKITQYDNALSYAEVQIIETLGLDYWKDLDDYKENLRVVYDSQIVLKK